MAERLNSEFNYRTQVEGETPWAKIKTLKGFLEGRKRAVALKKVNSLKMKSDKSKLKYLQENGPEWEALKLESEILEKESSQDDLEHAYGLAEKELEFIEKYLEELYIEANPTRIDGKTDDEMFELNAENEFATWVIREIQAEITATGRPSPAKLRNAMSSKLAILGLKQLNILPKSFEVITGHNDIKYLLDNDNNIEFLSKNTKKIIGD